MIFARLTTCVRMVVAIAVIFQGSGVLAQSATGGRIAGRVLDGTTGQGIPDVAIQVMGTTIGTMSGVDGRYVLTNVAAGTMSLQARRLGFAPKQVTGIVVTAGAALEQNISLEAATITLAAQVVTASAERGSVNEALDAQRTATGVVNAITAEQISKSPDSDAAQAVQRVSGVTVTGGKYVFVRGLGERYTTTQLNGTRVPSPEPERRVVPLDMFPSTLLEAITTSKTFTPDQQGDFSGAQVEIKTKEFPARRQFQYQLTMGYNSGATGAEILGGRDVGGEVFARAKSERNIPFIFSQLGNLQGINLTPGDQTFLVSQFRNAWTPEVNTGAPNISTNASLGGNQGIFGQRIGYLFSGTYSLTQDQRTGQVRALADRGNTPGSTVEIDRFSGETSSRGAMLGGLANFSTLIGGRTRLQFNNTYNRTADNDARRETGAFENEGIEARIDRMQYVERSIRSNQLAVEHQLSKTRVDWALTSSGVSRDEPDRSEFVYALEETTPGSSTKVARWLNTGIGGAVRTFSQLDENSREARANIQQTFSALNREHSIKIGGLVRRTEREADTKAYSISAPLATNAIRELPPELLFAAPLSGARADIYQISPLSQGGAYDASDRLAAGYVMAEVSLSERLRLITGARFENDRLTVNAQSTLGAPVSTSKDWTDVLPSAALNLKLSDWQNVRISASQTLARPEYRELVPIKSRDVLNGDDLEGNPNLERTRIRNFDVRWELYPDVSELLSIGVFAKEFDQPIERVYRAAGASSRFIGFVNADKATNYGLEIEARKGLGFLGDFARPLLFFSNLTLMKSEIDLGAQQAAATNQTRSMVGQAPYVVNTGLTYTNGTGSTSATILFNRTGERIDAAGDSPLPDVIQVARNSMDVSLRFPVMGVLHGRFDARNVLDDPFKSVQGTVVRDSWRAGRVFQLGFIVRP